MLERVRLGGFSGTYSLRSAELARDRKNRTIGVTVLFLDDSTHIFQIDVSFIQLIIRFSSKNTNVFFHYLEKIKGIRTTGSCFSTLGTI